MSNDPTAARPYHHGDAPATLVRHAVEAIAELGVAGTSVREVARRAGVSHAAAAYHFGDRAGLLTAVATEGYGLLGDALATAQRERRSFLEVGVAYVRFSLDHPAHFDVMYQPDLYDADDPDLRAAKAATAAILYGGGALDDARLSAGVAAWSIVHGLATLWRSGNLPPALGDDPLEITRMVAGHLSLPGR